MDGPARHCIVLVVAVRERGSASAMATERKAITMLYLVLVWLNHALRDVEQCKVERMAEPIWFWWQEEGVACGAVLGGTLPKWRKRGGEPWRGKEANGGRRGRGKGAVAALRAPWPGLYARRRRMVNRCRPEPELGWPPPSIPKFLKRRNIVLQ
jgi:hypothetical protein